jgi:hypothetical protein
LLQLIKEKGKYLLFKGFYTLRAKNGEERIFCELLKLFMQTLVSYSGCIELSTLS